MFSVTSVPGSRKKPIGFLGCLLILTVLSGSRVRASEPLKLLAEIPIPENHAPFDLRWDANETSEAGALLVALGQEGVIRLKPGKVGSSEVVLVGDRRPGVGFFYSTELASSKRFLVASAPVGGLTWLDLQSSKRGPDFGQRVIVDVDVHEDQLLLLGVRSGDDGEWAPDGAIAWLGSLSKNLQDLRPVMFSETDHAEGMALCAVFDHGAVRFLEDGSFLVVPGTEPGVFLYAPDGKLQHTWDAGRVGIDTGCGPSNSETFAQFAKDWKLRHTAFLNRSRILEDIVELPQGPALIVRQVESGVVRWYLKVLPEGQQQPATYLLPVGSTTTFASIQGDVRNNVLALALSDFGEAGVSGDIPQKLFLVEVPVAPAEP